MTSGNLTVDQILAVVGALTVLLSVVANLPGVSGSKAGGALKKLTAIDIVGLIRLIAPLLSRKPEPPRE